MIAADYLILEALLCEPDRILLRRNHLTRVRASLWIESPISVDDRIFA
jgi:hypothetical protein